MRWTTSSSIALSLLALVNAACTSDDASGPPAEGLDSGLPLVDATIDHASPGTDSGRPDTSTPDDASTQDVATPGDASDAGDGGDAAGNAITGRSVTRHWNDTATTLVPQDLSTQTVQVVVPGGTNLVGAGLADGTFAIPNVPAGKQIVQVGPWFLVTDQRTLDLAIDTIGRDDALIGDGGTSLQLDVKRVQPGQGELLFGSMNTGFITDYAGTFSTTTAQDTISLLGRPLLEAAKGDQFFVAQLGNHDGGGVTTVGTIDQAFLSSAVTTPPGVTTIVDAGLSPIGVSAGAPFNWLGFAFAQAGTRATPATTYQSATAFVATAPVWGLAPQLATLVNGTVTGPPSIATTNDALGMVTWRNPFNAAWLVYAQSEMNFDVTVAAPPGATNPGTLNVPIVSLVAAPSTVSSTAIDLSPIAYPVTAPKVDGQDATTAVTAASSTPTISWTASPTGTAATMFRIDVTSVSANGANTQLTPLGTFHAYTKDTSFTMPPGVLATGHYVFTISARAEPNLDPSHPFGHSLPLGRADMVTGLVAIP